MTSGLAADEESFSGDPRMAEAMWTSPDWIRHILGRRGGVFHRFPWENRRFTIFDGPTGTSASIADINDRGDLVGVYLAEEGTVHGFLLRAR